MLLQTKQTEQYVQVHIKIPVSLKVNHSQISSFAVRFPSVTVRFGHSETTVRLDSPATASKLRN